MPVDDEPKRWAIRMHSYHLTIGCQAHSYDAWFSFTDDEITAMHNNALPFWRIIKDDLMAIATKLGYWKPELDQWHDDWL